MKKPLWKIQPMARPTEAHAADAVEIINGEQVRKVALPQLDYDVYLAFEAGQGTDARELSIALKMQVDVIASALHRLAAAGLLKPGAMPSIQ